MEPLETLQFYAGIGSRKTPLIVQHEFTRIATTLKETGYILRSGEALGADTAFEQGSLGKNEIFSPKNCPQWAIKEASKYVPENYGAITTFKPHVQRLLGRNMQIILGQNGNLWVNFVICWTPSETTGGTSYGVKAARDRNIPVYNFYNHKDVIGFYSLLKTI